jgi:hypothetical protein
LHPNKAKKLDEVENDFMNYFWAFPDEDKRITEFTEQLFRDRARIRKIGYVYFISKECSNLKKLQEILKKKYKINSLVYRYINGIGTVYYELNINKKEEVQKLIANRLIPNIFKPKKSLRITCIKSNLRK